VKPALKALKLAIGMAVAAAALPGQSLYPRHNFTLGFGGAQPQQQLEANYQTRPGLSVGYGYRFSRYFQADVGFDTVFGAAGVRDYLASDAGYLRIRDYEFFVPVGARGILPLFGGRLLISGGGGGAYLRYAELVHQPNDYYRYDCPACGTRSGWGYYALASAGTYVDRAQHFRVGVVAKMYRANTSGDSLGAAAGDSRDRWLNLMGEFGFSF
jgi:hypothetical protein